MPEAQYDDVRLTPGRVLLLALVAALVAVLAAAVITFPADDPRLADVAIARTPESKLTNPVTAVLINFRGYDTMLEVAVLLLAVVGIWSMARAVRIPIRQPDTPLLAVLVRYLMPLMLLVAGYMYWIGSSEPGGAFQGGAVLGGMGVLWAAAAVRLPRARARRLIRFVLVIGAFTFVSIAVAMLFLEGRLLQYNLTYAKELILAIEGPALFSIGITLALLFVGGNPESEAE